MKLPNSTGWIVPLLMVQGDSEVDEGLKEETPRAGFGCPYFFYDFMARKVLLRVKKFDRMLKLAHLAVSIMAENESMRNLGWIGGLGPGSTIHYYQELVKAQAGEMLIVHADVNLVLGHVARGESSPLAVYFARLIERLAKGGAEGGAEVAAISAVTPHYCIRELKAISVLPLVSIVDEVNEVVRASGYRRVALFGTRFVVESGMFGMLEGVDVVTPSPEQVVDIHETYMGSCAADSMGRHG